MDVITFITFMAKNYKSTKTLDRQTDRKYRCQCQCRGKCGGKDRDGVQVDVDVYTSSKA